MLASEKVPLIFKTLIDIRARSYLVKKLLIKTIIEEKKEVLIKQSTVGHLLVKPVGNLKFATNKSFMMH